MAGFVWAILLCGCTAACDVTRSPAPAPRRAIGHVEATLGEAPAAPLRDTTHWSRHLPRALYAVERCTAAGSIAHVSRITPQPGGWRIRLREENGSGADCEYSEAGTARIVASLSPPLPPDERTRFTAPNAVVPHGVCVEHQRALDDNGALLGWLWTEVC
jgi:hypothetical protein